ncbi:hypothetical protein VNO80_21176 [Phaseolus coccineus]|uniref:Uncharacterized protein n=1 Tax=Phaseolus coccineus TaxID=3886 RepID=A0AAN9QXG1_PHACN
MGWVPLVVQRHAVPVQDLVLNRSTPLLRNFFVSDPGLHELELLQTLHHSTRHALLNSRLIRFSDLPAISLRSRSIND